MEELEKRNSPKAKIDKKTGREVMTKAPYADFEWREGQVLREITTKEASDPASRGRQGAIVGGVIWEWVPAGEVEIDEEPNR